MSEQDLQNPVDQYPRPPYKKQSQPWPGLASPGPIWTPLQVSGGATQEKLEKFGGQTPLGRAGQPAELGSIYVQLAAADASYATGQVYGAAGGSGQP
jgi:hypothetical protein